MPTNDHGDLGRTKLCRLCQMRCTKGRDFYDPERQVGDREKYMTRIACRFCISHMEDRGEVDIANGVLTIYKVPCRRCKQAKTPAEMSNLCWCKECHAKHQREYQAKHPRPKKPTKRDLLDRLLTIHAQHSKAKKHKCRCALCQTIRPWRAAVEAAEKEKEKER